MALVPLEGEPSEQEPGVLKISDRQIQQTGVRIGDVLIRQLVREIDATGTVEFNHHRHATVTNWIPGKNRVEKLYYHFTGEAIEKGAVVADLYSPTIDTGLEEYRQAVEGYESVKEKGAPETVEMARSLMVSARERLSRFGLSEEMVKSLAASEESKTGEARIPIHSPMSGVLMKPTLVKEGEYVQEGTVLYHIADLSTLWLFIDIYESELPFVNVGQKIDISTRSNPGEDFEGKISFIEPFVQGRTRTIRVRAVIDNADSKLKPGMFARARIYSELPDLIAVPESAVIRSGRRNIVIVAEGNGRFRPKLVALGRTHLYAAAKPEQSDGEAPNQFEADDRYHEVLKGLSAGDRVVVAGNFLLNAEAQFQGIIKKMLEAAKRDEEKPAVSEETRQKFSSILETYFAIQKALTQDSIEGLAGQAKVIPVTAKEIIDDGLDGLPEGLKARTQSLLERLSAAAKVLSESEKPDPKKARKQFANLSRGVIAWLRDFEPARVDGGEFHVFKCPMANDEDHQFGYELWVQKEKDIANPYMGKMMPG